MTLQSMNQQFIKSALRSCSTKKSGAFESFISSRILFFSQHVTSSSYLRYTSQCRCYSDYFSMVRRDVKTFRTPEEVKKEEQEKVNAILGKPKDAPTDKLTPEETQKIAANREEMKKILLELDKRAPKAQPNVPPLWQRLRMTYILIAILLISFLWTYLQDRTHIRMAKLLERDDY